MKVKAVKYVIINPGDENAGSQVIHTNAIFNEIEENTHLYIGHKQFDVKVPKILIRILVIKEAIIIGGD